MATVFEQPSIRHERHATPFPGDWTLADLQDHLGGVPAGRIRMFPHPGTATEQDLFDLEDRGDKLLELIDGILVEKAVGWEESIIAMTIAHAILSFLEKHNLGQVLGPDAVLRLLPNRFRAADVAFVGWHRFLKPRPGRRPIPRLIPDLAIEVLSETNTAREIELKIKDHFEAGVTLVWIIDPETRTARVYNGPVSFEQIASSGVLDGAEALPGLKLPLTDIFARLDREPPSNDSTA